MRLTRRSFAGSLIAPALELTRMRCAAAAPPMKVTKVETVYWPDRAMAPWWPHWTWVRVHTDTGIVGLGETYPKNETEAAAIHAAAKSALLGRDPRDIERIWTSLYDEFDYYVTGGAEMRALSAIDLALWDLLGKALDTPVYRLIGGKTNPRIRLYNTCFPHKYDFNKEPEKIMRELIDKYSIRAIKIWPFDGAAIATGRVLSPPRILRKPYRRSASCGTRLVTRLKS